MYCVDCLKFGLMNDLDCLMNFVMNFVINFIDLVVKFVMNFVYCIKFGLMNYFDCLKPVSPVYLFSSLICIALSFLQKAVHSCQLSENLTGLLEFDVMELVNWQLQVVLILELFVLKFLLV